jgi:hypothetical protein
MAVSQLIIAIMKTAFLMGFWVRGINEGLWGGMEVALNYSAAMIYASFYEGILRHVYGTICYCLSYFDLRCLRGT